jgi:hypothetical protein
MRRLIVALTVVVLGVGTGAIVSASASNDDDHGIRVIFRIGNVTVSHVPPNPGDTFLVGGDVLDTENHRTIGTSDTSCVQSFADHALCQAAVVFTGKGQIMVAGEITGLVNSPPSTLAITGGSGRYRGAKGEIHFVPVSATESRVTFLLNSGNS